MINFLIKDQTNYQYNYNSHNTDQLDKLKLSKLLQDLSLVKDFLKVTK